MDKMEMVVENREVMDAFKRLEYADKQKFVPAFQKAIEVLKNEAISKLKEATKAWNKPNKVYNVRPYENIIGKAWKEGNAAFVHIRGLGKQGTGYLLNFLEGGTKKRYKYIHYIGRDAIGRHRRLRKRNETAYLGKMPKTEFFTKAYNSKAGETLQVLQDEMKNIIENIFKKQE